MSVIVPAEFMKVQLPEVDECSGASELPPGFHVPPGLGAPPGLDVPADTETFPVKWSLADETARLAEENLRLRLALQYNQLYCDQASAHWSAPGVWSMPETRPRAGTWCVGTGSAEFIAGKKHRTSSVSWPTQVGSVDEAGEHGEKGTVVMKGIPHTFKRCVLQSLLDDNGFASSYDFLYLPFDFSTQKTYGYAFISFAETEVAERFLSEFSGFSDWGIECSSEAETSWSVGRQGLQAHVERFRNSPVMHPSVSEDMKPAIFQAGVQIVFPPPTTIIKAPRTKKHV